MAAAVAVAVAAAGVVARPSLAVAGVAVAALIGVVGAHLLSQGGEVPLAARIERSLGRSSGKRIPNPGAVGRAGFAAGAAALAVWLILTGLIALLGAASGIVIVALLMAAATTAVAAWCWRRQARAAASGTGRTRAGERHHEPVTAARRPVLVPSEMSTPALCAAWQRSYFALLDLPPGPQRCAIVRLREGVLEELERRDPDGVTRWLDAGARAGSDPGRYLRSDR